MPNTSGLPRVRVVPPSVGLDFAIWFLVRSRLAVVPFVEHEGVADAELAATWTQYARALLTAEVGNWIETERRAMMPELDSRLDRMRQGRKRPQFDYVAVAAGMFEHAYDVYSLAREFRLAWDRPVAVAPSLRADAIADALGEKPGHFRTTVSISWANYESKVAWFAWPTAVVCTIPPDTEPAREAWTATEVAALFAS